MSHSSDNLSAKELTSPISQKLSELQELIIKKWVKEVKGEIDAAEDLVSPIIVNTIPVFLGNLAESLDGKIERITANDSNNVAEAHGSERARVTEYNPAQLVAEYNLLRDIVIETLRGNKVLSSQDESSIRNSFDEAIQKALMSFYIQITETRDNINNHLTHDIRTPLTSASLSLQLILKSLDKEDLNSEKENLNFLVRKVQSNIKYCNELTEAILDTNTKNRSHSKDEKNFKKTDMKQLVELTIEDMSTTAQKRIEISGKNVIGYWNANALRRVIENLVSNAFKYGAPDTPIEIKVSSTQGRALLSVHNKGEEIRPEELGLILRKFKRAEKEELGKEKGWGLGLSFCKEVAHNHAGSLGVESSKENGTTFTIDIPIDPRGIKINK